MKETVDIISAHDRAVASGKKMALATVVHVEGSAYRRPGARMLITEDGELTGAISGGCLEGDALQKALSVIMQSKSRLVTYDTSDEDDARMGLGLGCEGIIQVLLETIIEGQLNPIELLRIASASNLPAILVTIYNMNDRRAEQVGTKLLVNRQNEMSGDTEIYETELAIAVGAAFEEERSLHVQVIMNDTAMDTLIQFLPPVQSLVIIGAGNDVMPLVDIANVLGWDVQVLDGRPAYASKERFATACSVIVSAADRILEHVEFNQRSAVVLMTHNYEYDKAVLDQLLKLTIGYIGVLGPAKKLERMLMDLKAHHPVTHPNLYGPVGIDIGAETAEEIALSIIAEIKAVFANKKPIHLREKEGQIHGEKMKAF